MAVGTAGALGLIGDTDSRRVAGAAGPTSRARIRHADANARSRLTAEAGIKAVGIDIASAIRSCLADRLIRRCRVRTADPGAWTVVHWVCAGRGINAGVVSVADPAGTALVRWVGAGRYVDAGARQADHAVAALGVVRHVAVRTSGQRSADVRGANVFVVAIFGLAGFAETGVVTDPLGPDQSVAGIEIGAVAILDTTLLVSRYAMGWSFFARAALRGSTLAADGAPGS